MADPITLFQETQPSLESYWRSVILFGRNALVLQVCHREVTSRARTGRPISYHSNKFLDCSLSNPTEITLEALAEPFSRHLCEHIAHCRKQVTSRGSRFLDTCRAYNDGTATRDELLATTVRSGFNNVIDAFHIVGGSPLPIRVLNCP